MGIIMANQKFNFNKHLPPSGSPKSPPAEDVASLITHLDREKTISLLDSYKIIPRHKIRTNKKNDYPLDEIEKLKDLLLQWGVLQDILVIYSTEEDMYIIEAGHRRVTALDALIQEYQHWTGAPDNPEYLLYQKNIRPYEKGYVCKVINRLPEDIDYDMNGALEEIPEEVIDSEIRLIITNEGAREISPAIRAKNIQRLAKLYEQKNRGRKRNEKMNINESIAEQFHLKKRQVIYYKNTENLIPELQKLFAQEKFSLKQASELSSLEQEAQKEVAAAYAAGQEISLKDIKKVEPSLSSSDHASEKQDFKSPVLPASEKTKADIFRMIKAIMTNVQNLNQCTELLLAQDPASELWITTWVNEQKELIKHLL